MMSLLYTTLICPFKVLIFFFQAEDGIRDTSVTGVQTCALPISARFAVLDDRDQNEMMERANLGVFLEASRNPDSATGRALMTAMASAADVTFKDVVREACLSRDHFMAWTDNAGSAGAAAVQINAALGVDPDDRIEDVERDILDGPNLPRSRWEEMATILTTGSRTAQGKA